MTKRIFAITAHPDDIEFGMAGTLMLLAQQDCEIHYMNVANGSCGTSEYNTESIIAIRMEEAKKGAKHLNAVFHPPLVSDLEVYYDPKLVAKLCSIIREVAPDILFVPSPEDYMEDHVNTCRLAVTAAFSRGMQNFPGDPPRKPIYNEIVVYHAQPHGNRDALNRLVTPEYFVNIEKVLHRKTDMLAEHKSQKEWLDKSQGFDSYLNTMKDHAREMGVLSLKYKVAEGWRQHNPLGFCTPGVNPLAELLQNDFFAGSGTDFKT